MNILKHFVITPTSALFALTANAQAAQVRTSGGGRNL
jgi:hypothetical protein